MVPHAGVFGEGAEHNARGARDPLLEMISGNCYQMH
jgi:hypothetical protein